MSADGSSTDALRLIHCYLGERKQKVKEDKWVLQHMERNSHGNTARLKLGASSIQYYLNDLFMVVNDDKLCR